MTMYDTKAMYLISLIELQLNRKGYFIRREVHYGGRAIDALAESPEGHVSKPPLPSRFAIEYRVALRDSSPEIARNVKNETIPWLGGQIDLFWIYLYPTERVVKVPDIFRKVIKSEQSMIVKTLH